MLYHATSRLYAIPCIIVAMLHPELKIVNLLAVVSAHVTKPIKPKEMTIIHAGERNL
jgi:hypothetical protein